MTKKPALSAPSLSDLIFCALFSFIFFSSGHRLLYDGDVGYHVRAGQVLLATRQVPNVDIFSVISPPLPWIAHEWLSEVIMALIHRAAGLTGLVLFFSVLIALVYSLLFRFMVSKSNFILALIFTYFAVFSMPHWFARPHIFSLLLAFLFYYQLDRYEENEKNIVFLFPLLMLLWVNLHGGFVIGFVLIGVHLLGRRPGPLAAALVLCLLAALVNPQGYKILFFPFKFVSSENFTRYIEEFLAADFQIFRTFKYFLILMAAILALSRTSLSWVDLILFLFFLNMGLASRRHVMLFALIAAPILARQTEGMIHQWKVKGLSRFDALCVRTAQVQKNLKAHLFPVLFVAAAILAGATGKVQYEFSERRLPVRATQFILEQNIQGMPYNDDEFGDYLIYAAWPRIKVFADGRSDMYGGKFIKDYVTLTHMKPGWKEIVAKYNFDWIFCRADLPIAAVFLEKEDWKLVYSDKISRIFVKKDSSLNAHVKPYAIGV